MSWNDEEKYSNSGASVVDDTTIRNDARVYLYGRMMDGGEKTSERTKATELLLRMTGGIEASGDDDAGTAINISFRRHDG